MPAPTLDMVPPIRFGRRGRPHRRPDKLNTDKGCGHRFRRADRQRRGLGSNGRLDRHRWKVERTTAWLNRSRRLACTALSGAVVCLNQIGPLRWAFLARPVPDASVLDRGPHGIAAARFHCRCDEAHAAHPLRDARHEQAGRIRLAVL